MSICTACEGREDLGNPSTARWIGPDNKKYCSMHFINLFGHGEPLVKIENYEAPTRIKDPAPKKLRPKKPNTQKEIKS